MRASTIYCNMRVRIGLCLLAVCWPLLATAAPAFASDPHACCRRDGKHHCATMASSTESGPSVRSACPYSNRTLKFAGTRSSRSTVLIASPQLIAIDAVQSISSIEVQDHLPLIRTSRGPPLA